MRRHHLLALLLVTACRLPLAAADLISPDDEKALTMLMRTLRAVGFPDPAGATFLHGRLTVAATFDPGRAQMPLPSVASTTQETHPGSPLVTCAFAFDGLHLHLADGSWIIAMAYRFRPGPDDRVDSGKCLAFAPAMESALASIAHPFAPAQVAAWLEALAPEARPRASAALAIMVPISFHLTQRSEGLPATAAILHLAGWPDLGAAAVAIADQRARQFGQLRPWREPDQPFDPTGAYAHAPAEEQAWRAAHPTIIPEDPLTAFRRALFRWSRAQLCAAPEEALVPPATAAALCRTLLDPLDPQGNAARIAALLAAARLPPTTPANPTLDERLQSWEARPRAARLVVTGGTDGATQGTAFVVPPPAYQPDEHDYDGLIGLLDDERPSRCVDVNGARTVGDNALRALATLLKADPRALAGLPVDHPWTAAERRTTAKALELWWQGNRYKYVK